MILIAAAILATAWFLAAARVEYRQARRRMLRKNVRTLPTRRANTSTTGRLAKAS